MSKRLTARTHQDPERAFLVLDTETTGLPIFPRGPPGCFYHPGNIHAYNGARVIEVAWQVIDGSESDPTSRFTSLVLPAGPNPFCIHPTAYKMHSISPMMLRSEDAIGTTRMLLQLCKVLKSRKMVMVGHNVAFDWHVLMSEAIRVQCHSAIATLSLTPIRCTMYETTLLCGLKRKGNRPKWPTLLQLAQRLFGADFDPGRQHRALADVILTAKCFIELQRRALTTRTIVFSYPDDPLVLVE